MAELKIIETSEDIQKLITYLSNAEYVAYDCETTGVEFNSEIIGISICANEEVAYYIVLAKFNKQNNSLEYLDNKSAVLELLKSLQGKSLVMHNAIFDCMMANNYFKVNLIDSLHTDTMVLAHLLNENRRIGLKELAKEYYGDDSTEEQAKMKESVIANGGKLTKAQYEMYKADWKLMGLYGAKDALLTYKLFITLVPMLYEQQLNKFFYEEESMPLLKGPTYQLNTSGLKIDSQSISSLKKQLEAECLACKDFIREEIKPYVIEKYPGTNKKTTFNIGSSQQLSWLLFGAMGLEFSTLTQKGKTVCKDMGLRLPYTYQGKKEFIYYVENSTGNNTNPFKLIACDKKTLQKFESKYKWVAKLLEYQKKMKLLNTYVEGIEERVQYGIVRPSFLQAGTTSGRYSSRNPNFQNLPRDDKRIKTCIVSRPGKVFVGADYSQLEPRVFAYFSKDSRLQEAFNSADDFYSVIGMEVYGKYDCVPRKDGSSDAFGVKYKHLRDLSKVIALASTYGATPRQLSSTTGKNLEDTAMDIENYFERFPGVHKMMLDAHEHAKAKGYVSSLFGRLRRMPEAQKINKLYGAISHAELPYEARNTLNLAVNHTIQSTGASIVNRAAIKFNENCKLAGIEAPLVLQVHDSLVAECAENDAENVRTLLQDAMENTIHLDGIRLEAIPKVGKTLADV